jgi:tripartite-type tricarboxylate transporter receptor subunit TctC
MRESGLPELTLSFTVGLFAPARTPEAVVSRLNEEINRVMERPDIKNALLKFGFQNGAGTRDDFVTSLLADSEKWGPVAKGLGIKIE